MCKAFDRYGWTSARHPLRWLYLDADNFTRLASYVAFFNHVRRFYQSNLVSPLLDPYLNPPYTLLDTKKKYYAEVVPTRSGRRDSVVTN